MLSATEFAEYAKTMTGVQRSALGQSAAYFPYFAVDTEFDNAAARAQLEPAGISVAPLASYLERLLDFATRSRWGKRPIGRAEALVVLLGACTLSEVLRPSRQSARRLISGPCPGAEALVV